MSSYTRKFSQYLRKEKIDVTISCVKDPSHFVVKESPSVVGMSNEAEQFLALHQDMQSYYSTYDVSPLSFCKNSIVAAKVDKTFHRAQITRVVNSTKGLQIGIYMLDVGTDLQVKKDRIYKLIKKFTTVPYQAMEFKLLGLHPITLQIDPIECKMINGPASEWDESAQRYVRVIVDGNTKAQIEVYGIPKEINGNERRCCIFGTLYMTINQDTFCLNEALIKQNFAVFDEELLKSVLSIDSILNIDSDDHLSPTTGKMHLKSKKPERRKASSKERVRTPIDPLQLFDEIVRMSESTATSEDESVTFKRNLIKGKAATLQRDLDSSEDNTTVLRENTSRQDSSDSASETVTPSKFEKQATACAFVPSSNNRPKMDLRAKLIMYGMKSAAVKPPLPETKLGIRQKLLQLQGVKSPKESVSCDYGTKSNDYENALPEIERETLNFDPYHNEQRLMTNCQESDCSSSSVTSDSNQNLSQKQTLTCDSVSPSDSLSQQKMDIRQKLLRLQKLKSPLINERTSDVHNDQELNLIVCDQNESSCASESPVFMKSQVEFPQYAVINQQPHHQGAGLSSFEENSAEYNSHQSETRKAKSLNSRSLRDILGQFCTNKRSSSSQLLYCAKEHELKGADSSTIDVIFQESTAVDNLTDADSDEIIDSVLSSKVHRMEEDCASDKDYPSSPERTFMPRLHSDEYEPYFKTDMNFSDKSLWERSEVPALCLGEDVPSAILSTEKAPFSSKLRKVLDDVNFCGPSCIQSVVWPAMFRNRSLVAVSPPHSGKTLAYLLPLLSDLINSSYDYIPSSNGPILLILCSSWRKVRELNKHCRLFLRDSKVKVYSLFNDGISKRKKEMRLINGCDLLIATPSCLLEMLESHVTNFERCCHLILDDGNSLMKEIDQLTDVMRLLVKAIDVRLCSFSVQIVLCVERWTKNVASFIRTFLLNPLMFFTSFLESAIYAKVPISAHVCTEAEKKHVLLDILENAKKAVICASDIETASDVHHFLKYEGVRSFYVSEALEHYNADGVFRSWKAMQSTSTASCLVISDAALIKMNISDATCLIHFDVPEVSRLQFGYRFSCIAEHFSAMMSNKLSECSCHIIVSDDSRIQVPSLVKIMHRNGSEIPQELKDLRLKQLKATKDASVPLCHYYKAFGFCDRAPCECRHHMDSFADQPTAIVCEGDLQAIITHVFDASHFYARVLKCISPTKKLTLSFSSKYADVAFQLREFYGNLTHVRVESPIVGKSYVLGEGNNLFFRVRVLDVIQDETKRIKFKVLYLDEGCVKQQFYYQVSFYEIPEGLCLPPPLAVELYLCNIKTPDSSLDWSPHASSYMSDFVMGKIIMGKIMLCVEGTLWLHPMVLREKLPNINEFVNATRLDSTLKSSGFAKENKTHLAALLKACGNKIPLPKVIAPIHEVADGDNQGPEINYAFLECGVMEDVYVSCVNTPHQFYVHRAKFADILDDLVDDINRKVEKKLFKKQQPFQKGMHCIAPFYEDKRFYRSTITNISEQTVDLYYVDFGDTGSAREDEIYTIPPEYLQLPFQAIECELNGICAAHGGFSKSASDKMYNLTRDEAGDMKLLQIQACTKNVSYDGGNRYIVDMYFEEKSLSDILIEVGLVNLVEKHIFTQSQALQKIPSIPVEPSGYAISDDSLLSEEKDAAALFCGVLSGLISKETVIERSRNKNNEACPKKTAQVVSIEEVPPPVPVPSPSLQEATNTKCKPRIIWWNTEEVVHLYIQIKNVKDYEMNSSDNKFIFSTTKRDKLYRTEENLYSEVIADESKVVCTEQSVNVTLKKKVLEKWPRLTKENKRLHIKYDVNHVDLDSDDSEGESLLKLEPINDNRSAKSDYASPDYLTDEESVGSTDEDEKYVPSWSKTAEYRDPYNLFA